MSYCRNNGIDSDVYVIATANGNMETGWSCCGCRKPGNWTTNRTAMLNHLFKHREDGDKVPEEAIDRLKREIEEAIAAG